MTKNAKIVVATVAGAVALTAVLIVAAVAMFVANTNDNISDPRPGVEQSEPTNQDGGMQFVVMDVQQGLTSATDQYGLPLDPTGEYWTVDVEVTNVGDAARFIDTSGYYAIGDDGAKYDSESDTWTYEQLNPGQKKTVKVYFDVPVGAELERVELHGSFLSDGVEVKLP